MAQPFRVTEPAPANSSGARRRRFLAVAAGLIVLAGGVSAFGQKRVVVLGPQRGYDGAGVFEMVLTGSSMSTARQALIADGFSFETIELVTPASLVGRPILVLGLFDPGEALTAAEQSAVGEHVRSGGSLLYLGDNSRFHGANDSVSSLFDVLYSDEPIERIAADRPFSGHPLVNFPAGPVNTYDGSHNLPGFFGGIGQLGQYAQPVLRTQRRTVVAVIERNAMEPGSGSVVLVSDINGFLDAGWGGIELGDNLVLLRNIFAFLQTGCTTNADCDDGQFCNGLEQCIEGLCESGSNPCSAELVCDEATDQCVHCTADVDCDDGAVCNGLETCVSGACVPGADLCSDACEHCDESTGQCSWCLFDLDTSGDIGPADLYSFGECMGGCYPPGDPCEPSNFDGDFNGCVGSGDFGAFSACYGLSCAECPTCSGPAVGQRPGPATEPLKVRVVARPQRGTADRADALPRSIATAPAGKSIWVEVWVGSGSDEAPACAYVDLTFDSAALSAGGIVPTSSFEVGARGAVLQPEGIVLAVGGCGLSSSRSAAAWHRVASVEMAVLKQGVTTTLRARPSAEPLGISRRGDFRVISRTAIDFGGTTFTTVAPTAAPTN